jgi:LmbE family N-acetylglucosaminyl deacetylase
MNSRGVVTADGLGRQGTALVLAPHPDDEVFGVGGLMSMLPGSGYNVVVLAVTDGEASHGQSSLVTPAEIRDIRLAETERAYRQLGIGPARHRLGLPDAGLHSLEAPLRRDIEPYLHGATVLLAPLETDGHPDHDIVGKVACDVSRDFGLALWRYAVWARLHEERIGQGDPFKVPLPSSVVHRKQRAMEEYESQFFPLGPNPEDGPVLPGNFAQHFAAGEEFLWPAT